MTKSIHIVLSSLLTVLFSASLILFLPTSAKSQLIEDCNTIGDQDLDSLWDCAEMMCSATSPCSKTIQCSDLSFFQVMKDQLYRMDFTLRKYVKIGPAFGDNYNALGYNTHDGYLYAMNGTKLIRIDKNGAVTTLGRPDCISTLAPVIGYNVGDVMNGYYTFCTAADLIKVNPYNLMDCSTVAFSGDKTSGYYVGGDFAYNIVDKMIYSVAPDATLIRINPLTGVAKNLGPITGLVNSAYYGSCFFDSQGFFYIYANDSGDLSIADITLTNPKIIYVITAVETGAPAGENNDGASCSYFSYLSSVIPVKVIDFQSRRTSLNDVQISWSAASEEDVNYYELEISVDGKAYTPIRRVEPKDNGFAMNSYTEYISAELLHSLKLRNVLYTRLNIVSHDQKSIRVPASALNMSADPKLPLITMGPNPVADVLSVSYLSGMQENPHTLTIVDAKGVLVTSMSLAGSVELSTASWPAGVYSCTVSSADGLLQHYKLLKN